MKKVFISLAVLAFAVSCSDNFSVKGAIEEGLDLPEDIIVSLLDKTGKEVAQIPVENRKFEYELPADPTTCYSLVLKAGDDSESVTFIADKAKAKVNFGAAEATITGSPMTDKLNGLEEIFYELTNKAGEDIRAAYANDDDVAADAIEERYAEDLKANFTEPYLQNKDNYLGLYALNILYEYLEYEEAAELYEKGGEIIRNDEDINESLKAKKAKHDTSVGCKFVEISGKTAAGEEIKLSDFVGKGDYVLVDFWASWCGPCMRAIPNARALLQKYASKGFQLVGVNCWERKEGAGQAKAVEMEMTWPVIFAENTAPDAYGVEAIPTLILFGPDGTIVERLLGETGLAEVVAKYFE